MPTCVVPFCNSKTAGHRFPKRLDIRRKWVLAIQKTEEWEPSDFSRICKRHFLPSDYVLPVESVRKKRK